MAGSLPACCARAASGHAAAAPPKSDMKSRRRMPTLGSRAIAYQPKSRCASQQKLVAHVSVGSNRRQSPAQQNCSYSITSSASTSKLCGIVRPSALAVVRLKTISNFVGCSTGISPGLVPRRILSTISAARRNRSENSVRRT